MRIFLILVLCSMGAFGQQRQRTKVSASKKEDSAAIERKYSKEATCIKRLDTILTNKWNRELKKISIDDLGDFESEWTYQGPAKKMYNTDEQEWLMEEGSTSRPIDSCVREIVSKIVPMLKRDDVECLNKVFAWHIEAEIVYENKFKKYIEKMSEEQLPFHTFVSYSEFVETMYQNRNPDALTPVERALYEHAYSYLSTEQDEEDRILILAQECEWKNARALREAPNENAKYAEFVHQILDSVNKQLGKQVVQKWNLNSTLSNNMFTTWQKTRQEMMSQINEEVAKLRAQKKDAQWLCEYASKLPRQFSAKEAAILLEPDNSFVPLEVSKVAEEARRIEKALKKKRDFRHPVLKNLADEYANGVMCLEAFLHLIENHQRFDMARFFVTGSYNFPEFYCADDRSHLGTIDAKFCKCVGTFCVAHGLAAIFVEEYALEQAPDGTYKVVRSGRTSSIRKQSW